MIYLPLRTPFLPFSARFSLLLRTPRSLSIFLHFFSRKEILPHFVSHPSVMPFFQFQTKSNRFHFFSSDSLADSAFFIFSLNRQVFGPQGFRGRDFLQNVIFWVFGESLRTKSERFGFSVVEVKEVYNVIGREITEKYPFVELNLHYHSLKKILAQVLSQNVGWMEQL